MLLISLTYCMFMLNCFNDPALEEKSLIKICPSTCTCYTAPSNGIAGNDANSYICEIALPLFVDQIFNPKLINTLVIENGNFYKLDYQIILKQLRTVSLILENFKLSSNIINHKSIFAKFNPKSLKYISLIGCDLHTTLDKLDWNELNDYNELKALFIDNSVLNELDASFGSVSSEQLNTIVIRHSKLDYIDPQALKNKRYSLTKLILSNNQISNLIWLTFEPFYGLQYLDLSDNRLYVLPDDLKKSIPNVRTLYLDGNQFKSFDFTSISNWFGIEEFRLMPSSVKTNDGFNLLYWTPEMKWLTSLPEENINAFILVNSLINGIKYQVDGEQYQWRYLFDGRYIDYYPDQVYLDSKVLKFYYWEKQETISFKIEGFNLLDSSHYFYPTEDPSSYQQNRLQLKSSLNVAKDSNSIRIVLFDKRYVQYFAGQTTLTTKEIQSTIDQVLDFLDQAWKARQYVSVVLWSSEYLNFEHDIVSTLAEYFMHRFQENVLEPLLKKIQHHPSLIGFEIIDKAFTRFMTTDQLKQEPEQSINNKCPYKDEFFTESIKNEQKFINYNAQIISHLKSGHLISISFESSCVSCFIMATVKSCLSDVDLDYITIISDIDSQSQPFDYSLSDQKSANWFKMHPLQNPKIFLYVLRMSTDKVFTKMTSVIGYFKSFKT